MKAIITELFSKYSTKAVCSRIKKYHNDIYELIDKFEAVDFRTKLYMFYHDFTNIPKCRECNTNNVKLESFNVGFRTFCCNTCSKKNMVKTKLREYNLIHGTNLLKLPRDPKAIRKMQETNLKRYGTIMPMNDNMEIKAKSIKTSLEKYGVENAAHAPLVRSKASETMKNKSSEEKEKIRDKYKTSVFKKFGVDNPMKDITIQEKVRHTMISKFGVPYALQNIEISKKQTLTRINTMLEKYNNTNIFDIPEFNEKIKNTNIEKFGFENVMKNKTIQLKAYNNAKASLMIKYNVNNPMHVPGANEKRKHTSLEKYGVDNFTKTSEFKEICKYTMLEKYGVPYSILIPGNLEKLQSAQYSTKEYIWKTGEISIVQGYEPIVLKELEDSGYTFNDIIVNFSDKPIISYNFENKERLYIPDIYIPAENLIIEVKSTYTLEAELAKNQAKFQAVIDAGYDFRLEVR